MKTLNAENLFNTWLYANDMERDNIEKLVDLLYDNRFISFITYWNFYHRKTRYLKSRN